MFVFWWYLSMQGANIPYISWRGLFIHETFVFDLQRSDSARAAQSGVLEIMSFSDWSYHTSLIKHSWLRLGGILQMQGYRIFFHQSSTGIGSQWISRELPSGELPISGLVRAAGNMCISAEVSCCLYQFSLVSQSPASRWEDCVSSRFVKDAFEV